MRQRPRVALLIETSNEYARNLLRGILRISTQENQTNPFFAQSVDGSFGGGLQ